MTARRLDTVQEYYFSKKLREVSAMIADGKPIINMGIGSPDLPAHPEVVNALKKALIIPKFISIRVIKGYQNYEMQYLIFIKTNTWYH